MTVHLLRELETLKRLMLELTARVENALDNAVAAVQNRDEKAARKIIEQDHEVDLQEVRIEEECLKLLALYQPLAGDLRYIIAMLKINNDLERVGDLAVNIAERAIFLSHENEVSAPFDFQEMCALTRQMLRSACDAIIQKDPALGRKVCAMDDQVDAINREMYDRIKQAIRAHPRDLDALIHLLSVSRHLERVADHATNIAEDVIYMVEGHIVRHGGNVPA